MNSSIEQKLRLLFDYQNFENNSELLKLKKQTEESFANALDEEDLALVNAAGEFELQGGTITNNETDD